MVRKSKYKFIAVSAETHARLIELGNMHDSMDDVISRYLPKERSEITTWRCQNCGLHISGSSHMYPMVDCFECHQYRWSKGKDF